MAVPGGNIHPDVRVTFDVNVTHVTFLVLDYDVPTEKHQVPFLGMP